MSPTTRHDAHDKLLAQVQLIKKRLGRFDHRLGTLDDVPQELGERMDELTKRCEELEAEVVAWSEVEIGVPTLVDDLAGSVDALEADLDVIEPAEVAEYEVALDRQVRAWQARVDRFRLQRALGRMEARDDLDELTRRLDHVRGDVLVQLQNAADDSKELVSDLRVDVEAVLGDVRRAVERVAASLTPRR